MNDKEEEEEDEKRSSNEVPMRMSVYCHNNAFNAEILRSQKYALVANKQI